MTTYNVAPIYTDAWAKTLYEGVAKVVAPIPNSPDTTLLGVTCRNYWVQFFFTEICVMRWVEISSITTYSDLEDYQTSITAARPNTYNTNEDTEICVVNPPVAATDTDIFIPLPAWSNQFTLARFSCRHACTNSPAAQSTLRLSIMRMGSATPATAATEQDYVQTTTFTASYVYLAHDVSPAYTMLDQYQHALRIRWHIVGGSSGNCLAYIRSIQFRRLRAY
jgi:hypothetical protein